MNIKALSELLDLLREKGVSEFEGVMGDLGQCPVRVTLLPKSDRDHKDAKAITPAQVQSLLMTEPDTSMCKCGHHVTEHNSSGQCIQGCLEDKCSPEIESTKVVVQ